MVHVVRAMKSEQKPRPKNVVFVGDFNVDERMTKLAWGLEQSTYNEARLNKGK